MIEVALVSRNTILTYLNKLLKPNLFQDYVPNGLQVEGRINIKKLITGVTASQDLLKVALNAKADAILVHHGYFWRNEKAPIIGIKKARLKLLLEHDINLFAYHLPLDAHPEFGNNAQLGIKLNIQITGTFAKSNKMPSIGNVGQLHMPCQGKILKERITTVLEREPLYIPGKVNTIKKVAWSTGMGQSKIDSAVECGVDAYITGEVSESTVHIAKESGIHFFSAGHHATERYGVQAIGVHLAKKFNISHAFIDMLNPV